MSARVDVPEVLRALAALAGYRLKEKRQKVISAVAAGRPVHIADACNADRAEYLREQALAASDAFNELVAAARAELEADDDNGAARERLAAALSRVGGAA